MTCIVGLIDADGSIYMGGDSACVDEEGWALNLCYDKVFVRDDFIYGYSGESRFCQLVEFAFEPPEIEEPLDKYMVTAWMDSLRETLIEGGCTKKEHNREEIDGSLLVGVRGRLFHVYGGFECLEYRDSYGTVGCAYQVALGNLAATEEFDIAPKERIKMALKTAERYSAAVRSPFQIIVLKAED